MFSFSLQIVPIKYWSMFAPLKYAHYTFIVQFLYLKGSKFPTLVVQVEG